MSRWVGKVAVVTGASAGIGAATALTLADAGMTVIGLARRTALIDELAGKVNGSGSIKSKFLDLSDSKSIPNVFSWVEENFGGIQIMVNNGGVLHLGHITEFGDDPVSDDQISTEIDTNVKGLILCTRLAVSSMKKFGFPGHIVNINSVAGHYIPSNTTMNVYAATKYAVSAFTASLINELARLSTSIKTTSISPGLVNTDMAGFVSSEQPCLQPQDVADAILYVVNTPPHLNISELTINPVNEILL